MRQRLLFSNWKISGSILSSTTFQRLCLDLVLTSVLSNLIRSEPLFVHHFIGYLIRAHSPTLYANKKGYDLQRSNTLFFVYLEDAVMRCFASLP